MKKFTLFSLVMLSAALAFTSCSKELDPGQVRTKEVAVSLATRLPSAPQSRAVTEQVADIEGYHLRYILEIWTSGDKPELYKRIVKEADADKTTSFDVTLLSGRTFDFLLWADYAEDGGNEDMHYTTVNGLKEVSRSEKTYITDEQHDYGLAATRDAFSAHKQVTADAPINKTITLTRAVAQLNIFTTDYEQVEESFRPAYTGLTITTAADFNVLTGTSFGSATSDLRSYVAVKTEKEGTTPDKNKVFTGYYFTSSEGKNVVDMDVHFYRADNSEVVTYNMTNIPLQQNYRTNVTGALLTQTGTLHVETEAAFAGDDIETTEPKDTPTETGLYYSLDGEDWTKWETADMPEGTYSSFAALSVGGQKLTQNHLTAIKDRNLEVIDLSKAIFERNTMFNNSFENSTALRSFIFPENITYMPAYFFKGCSNLVSVGLTDAMTYIGAGGFQNCTSLTEVTLPESVTTLRTMAFRGCTNLRTVNLSNITTYERLLFEGCEHLEIQNVTFPNDMTAIPDQIFANCKSIRAVTFPPQLETIGYNAFSGCSGITEINLPLLAASAAVRAQEKKVDGGLAVILDKKIPDRATPVVPPGARSLRNMAAHCTGCQLCVSVCPDGVLRPSARLATLMQPEMSYERGYCRPECAKCAEVCPTDAIRLTGLAEKSSIQIGHAVWVKENCVPLTDGVDCGNCARHCPTGAITMVPSDPDTADSPKIPVVNEERCIGCGACENLCPARPFSAIYIEGHENHRTI